MTHLLSALLCTASLLTIGSTDNDRQQPNILFLMGDDWSWPHAGFLGDPVIKTPTFDRLAREGVVFENAFVSSPSCTPSRMAIVTGQWHWRLGEAVHLGGSLSNDVAVYPELLEQEGYRIGFARKGAEPSKHAYRGRDPFGPRYRSFEAFLEDREPGEPFCFWYGAGEPHRPYRAGTGVKSGLDPTRVVVPGCLPDDETVRSDLCDYLEAIQRFDRDAAAMLAKLEARGELDDTIIVLSGDNGLPFPGCKATLRDTGTRVPLVVRWPRHVPGGRTVRDFVSLTDLAPTFLEAARLPIPEAMTGRGLLSILKSGRSGQVEADRASTLTGMERHVYPYPSRALRTADFLYIRNFQPERWPTGESREPAPPVDYEGGQWPTHPGAFSFNIDPSPTKQFLVDNRDDPAVKPFFDRACGRRPTEELYDLRTDPEQLRNVADDPAHAATRKQLADQLTSQLRESRDPRFADARSGAFEVKAPPAELNVDPIYRKYIDADGYPIVASGRVNDYALKEAAFLVGRMLAHRPDVKRAMVASGSRMIVIAHDEFTTDLPEFAHFEPKDYWDARARGTGGSRDDPYVSCGEENLLRYPGDPYATECILIHEFAHNIHLRGLVEVDPTFDTRLEKAYDRAMADGLWKGKYASVNHHEYFAEGVQSWFNDNREPDHDHNHVNTRKELEEYDPALATFCGEVFGDTRLVYTKPIMRPRDHLAGYDPATAPSFVWPERLDEVRAEIRREARARSKSGDDTIDGQDVRVTSPNVLFIALDDMNDWIGCLGGHPQAKTPNLDRLAAGGLLFSNAHCPGASCNPSRSAIMTGIPPHRSGLYSNLQKMRVVLPDAELIPAYFSRHGYRSSGSGKILHYFIDARSWDDYYPNKETEDPFPPFFDFGKRPKNLPWAGPWMYRETDWGGFDVSDDEFLGDALVAKWVGQRLREKQEKPFFLACGIYRPHEPWFVPKRYYDLFPPDEIQLPPGVKENDLLDVPPVGQRLGRNRYFAHIRKHDAWKDGIRGYLASIAYADAMVGRVLDALDQGPHRDNTIVVLWGDHGWHLGEKEHWQKYTGWRVCSRVPLIVRVPSGVVGLPEGTLAGGRCARPVNLVDLYKTLTELCGLPEKEGIFGNSLVPLLRNPQAEWDHASLTHLDQPGNYAISTERWRYIHYHDGGEELYDTATDRYEWTNLAGRPELAAKLTSLRSRVPERMAVKFDTRPDFRNVAPTETLPWARAADGACPPSRNSSRHTLVVFENHRASPVTLDWIDAEGKRQQRCTIRSGEQKRQLTYAGHAWLISNEAGEPLGHFVAGSNPARAVIR